MSIRTLKSDVKDELTIPQQHRYLVSIELGRVERHVSHMLAPKEILIVCEGLRSKFRGRVS
jgi:hypothetical protein